MVAGHDLLGCQPVIGVGLFVLGLKLLLLLGLVDHDLLHTLDHALITVTYHLVDAVEGGGALAHEARLRHHGPVSREEDAPLSASLANFDQFIFHENTLFNRIAFLEGAHDVPGQCLWIVGLHSFNVELAGSTLTQQRALLNGATEVGVLFVK